MTKEIIIVLLLIALFYYYRQSQTKTKFLPLEKGTIDELGQVNSTNQTLVSFLRSQLNSNNLEELKTKLGEKTLDEILEENEDYETEVDTLTRTKQSLEKDLTAQTEAFQARLREKDREVKKVKEDLTSEQKRLQATQQNLASEKAQSKGSVERINLLSQQIQKQEQLIRELKVVNQTKAEKKVEYEQQQKELAKLKEQNQFYLENIKTKEGIIREYQTKTTEASTEIISSYLTEKIKASEAEFNTLNLSDSVQFQRSKQLKQNIKFLRELVERERERESRR